MVHCISAVEGCRCAAATERRRGLILRETENLFAKLIDEASVLSDQLRRLASESTEPSSQSQTAMPAPLEIIATVEPWFTAQYLAGMALLRDDELSPAADLVLRGLTELFAGVAWIFEGGSVHERPCRAVCYAQGMVRAMIGDLRGQESVNAGAAQRIKELGETEQAIRGAYQTQKCKCKPWNYGKVGPTLKAVSKKHEDLAWAYQSWKWASAVIHHALPSLPPPERRGELPRSSYLERGIQLLRFVHVLVNFGIILLEVDHREKVATWRGIADALVANPTLKDAVGGRLDSSL
jgi:hypothetical protein